MGRRSVVAGDEFLPGMTLDDLRRLIREEKDPRNVVRYMVMYNYKAGRTIKETADVTGQNPETVRRWIVTARKKGPEGIPRRIAKGGERLLTRRQRAALVKDVHKGPRALGYATDVWTYKDLWLHAKKRFNVKISYPGAVRNFHEMGIVLKTPRPKHPKAASEEERADFQRETRAVILKYARQGFVIISGDEAHIQAYGNTCKTLGLRGIEAIADSAVERARLTVIGGVGEGFFYLKMAKAGNGAEFIAFCERLLALFGKVLIILDYASYHMSHEVKAYAKENAHRLKLHFTLKYTPNDNIAEAQWPSVKAAIANKQIQSRDHIVATIGKAFESGEITPVTPYSYTRVTTRRVGKKEAGEIKAKIGKDEYFCYEEMQFNERVRIPTAEDLREKRDAVLPAEKRAELPHQLASSDLPDKFLANLPPILLAK